MVEDRDAHAKVLAAPFDRDKAERARAKFLETQALIDAIDRAIAGEHGVPSPITLRLSGDLARHASKIRGTGPGRRARVRRSSE